MSLKDLFHESSMFLQSVSGVAPDGYLSKRRHCQRASLQLTDGHPNRLQFFISPVSSLQLTDGCSNRFQFFVSPVSSKSCLLIPQ